MDALGTSVLVVSDSHGNVPALTAALSLASGEADCAAAVFLGDGVEDLDAACAAAGFCLPRHTVRGNGDWDFSLPESAVIGIAGRRLFLAHGHRYHVERGPAALAAAARAAGAEAALFGHTHVPFSGTVDGVFCCNPGSASRPRSGAGPGFALLDIPASGPQAAWMPPGKGKPAYNPCNGLRGFWAARFFALVPRGRSYAVRPLTAFRASW